MNKSKKILWITLIAIDVIITGFLFVLSIIMLANVPQTEAERQAMPGLIGILANNGTLYLWTCVIPLFVLLAANIIGLVIYVRKTTKKEPVRAADLTPEQKAELLRQLSQDLNGGKTEPAAEAPKAEEPAAEEPKPEA